MVSIKIVDYALKCFKEGYSYEQIRKSLLKEGFSPKEIDELKTNPDIINAGQFESEKKKSPLYSSVKKLPLQRLIITPQEYFRVIKKKANLIESILIFALFGTMMGFLRTLSRTFLKFMEINFHNDAIFGMQTEGGFFGIVINDIYISLVLTMISVLVYVILLFIFLKLFRGKGSFVELFYCYSHTTIALTVYFILLSLAGALVGLIPIVGPIVASIIMLYLFGFSIYIITTMIKEIGEFSSGRAIFTWLLPLLIGAIVWIVLSFSFLSELFANNF